MAVIAVVLLQACSTAQIDDIPQEFGGLPKGTPQRPAEGPAYPAVHDMPPTRSATLLDEEQQKKLESDLIATRNRQPNQEKNRAKEKKRAEQEAKAKDKDQTKSKKKTQNLPESRSGTGFGGIMPAPQDTGASRNP